MESLAYLKTMEKGEPMTLIELAILIIALGVSVFFLMKGFQIFVDAMMKIIKMKIIEELP
ncbi:MAG: hypothetical protein AAB907_00060 [Patescibacteria group bacterium]